MPSPIAAALLAASLAFAGGAAGSAATDHAVADHAVATEAPDAGSGFASGPSVVEVPLEESLEIRPAAGWTFADCSGLRAASKLVTACTPEAFTVTGPAYDASIAPVRVSVPLRSGDRELTVDYVIRLAEPTPPSAPDTTIDLPLRAGAVSLIPLSELGLECGLCSPGEATIEVGAVAPSTLGRARVTGSHLVFSAAPDAQGAVEIDLRVRDDIGTASNTFKVTLHVSKQTGAPLHGLHLLVGADAATGGVELDARTLIAALGAEPAPAVVISGCGPALHGAVHCTPDGSIVYEPEAGGSAADGASSLDEFGVRLVASDGRQTLASVVVTNGAATRGTAAADTATARSTALAPAAGAKRAKLDLALPRPPVKTEEKSGGATTGFSELLDAIGAR